MPRVVMVNAPDSLLEERRKIGVDASDEMWDGVMHLVPPAGRRHGERQFDLAIVAGRALRALGWHGGTEIGVFRPGVDHDYRVPDLAFAETAHVSDRGIEGAAVLAIEIRSPGDETWEKLGFYGDVGVQHLLIIDPEAATVHLLINRDGQMVEQQPGPRGQVTLPILDAEFWFDGDTLMVRTDGDVHRV